MPKAGKRIDLGSGFEMRYFGWSPDRDLNPEFDDCPDVEKAGIIVSCPHDSHGGGCHFIIPGHRLFQDGWTVQQEEPLTLSPSILMTQCGCHGYIREGKWVNA